MVPQHSGVMTVSTRWSGAPDRLGLVVIDQPVFGGSPIVQNRTVVAGQTYEVAVVMRSEGFVGSTGDVSQSFELSAALD